MRRASAAVLLAVSLGGCAWSPGEIVPLTKDDVAARVKAGTETGTVIREIEVTGSRFYLTTADVLALREAGVPDLVIDRMLSTAWRPPRVYYRESDSWWWHDDPYWRHYPGGRR